MPLWTVAWNFPCIVQFLQWEADLPIQFCILVAWMPMPWPFWLRTSFDQGWAGSISPWRSMLVSDDSSYSWHPRMWITTRIPALHARSGLQTFSLLKTLKAAVCVIFCKLCFPAFFVVLLRISYSITLSVSLAPSNWTKKLRAKMSFE